MEKNPKGHMFRFGGICFNEWICRDISFLLVIFFTSISLEFISLVNYQIIGSYSPKVTYVHLHLEIHLTLLNFIITTLKIVFRIVFEQDLISQSHFFLRILYIINIFLNVFLINWALFQIYSSKNNYMSNIKLEVLQKA